MLNPTLHRNRSFLYSTIDGFELERPNTVSDALIWLVGKKKEDKESFIIPQQKCWRDAYKTS